MKIEWLNDEMTEARLTRGWWRKETALVRRISKEEWDAQSSSCWWRFVPSDRACDEWHKIESQRQQETNHRAAAADWQPVKSLPVVRVIKTDAPRVESP